MRKHADQTSEAMLANRPRTSHANPEAATSRAAAKEPDCVVAVDEAGRVRYFSPEAEAVFGYPKAEILAEPIDLLLTLPGLGWSGDDAGHDFAARGRRFGAGERVAIGRRRDGTTFPIGLAIREVPLRGGNLFGCGIRDLTLASDRTVRDEAMRARLTRAQPDAAVEHLARLSPDPESPRSQDRDNGRSASVRTDDRARARQATAMLVQATERAAAMLPHLRTTVEQRDVKTRREHLTETIEASRSLAASRVDEMVTFSIDVAPDAEDVVIDRSQIQQVLLNLLRNALEAMDCQASRKVAITARRAGDMVVVRVADTGPGLTADIRSRLFQPFASTKLGRMGVGLSLCRTIVEAHGGEIQAEDADAAGAVFRFTIPRAP
jgi:two-component system sensor kinase FixL